MGERHIFVRFRDCHMSCGYCDEKGKKSKEMSLAEILDEAVRLERKSGPHTFVSLTGGEPLVDADFLMSLCEALKKRKFRILLETSGVLWRQFSKVRAACDTIAMDLKLPSVTGQNDFLEEHRKFLDLAKRKKVYIKVVISRSVDLREYDKHLRMVARVAPQTPVFLQPMSARKKVYPDPALMRFLDKLQRTGAGRLSDVRVGIQLHKVMNIP